MCDNGTLFDLQQVTVKVSDERQTKAKKHKEKLYKEMEERRHLNPRGDSFSADNDGKKTPQYRVEPKQRIRYTVEEAKQEATKYFNGDALAADVWVNKYALKDSDGNIYEKSPDEMHHRLASEIARIEQNYRKSMSEEEIYNLFKDFKYVVPAGSPMAGIGNEMQISSLSNCFVIGNEGNADSYGAIMKTDEEQVQLMKRRGGVGHDLSGIRPQGSKVNNTALTSTGIVPFMERYSNSTREVAQDGRRGALMLSISIKHPDAEKFIDAKLQQGKITGANISVRITDEFMQCVKDDKEFTTQFPIDAEKPVYVKNINAKALWNKIIHNAWASAEPGVLFWDTIKRESVPDCYSDYGFTTVSTNPCGEIPLCPYDSCRLIAINLYSYVENPFTPEAKFNFDLFKEHVGKTTRIMDDIVDLELEKIDTILHKINSDPESSETKRVERLLWMKIKEKCQYGRRMGIGITGEGDMLAAMGIRYGSDEAINFSTEVQQTLACEAYSTSSDLASERGAFPMYNFEKEKDNPFINRIGQVRPDVVEKMRLQGRRNIALLTIAPTGSVSICTQTTSGIEPAFTIYYTRRKKVNPNDTDMHIDFTDVNGDAFQEFKVFHHGFVKWLKINGYNLDDVKNYDETQMQNLIKESPYYMSTANDIDWVAKVKMQGAMQKWVDHSISVTVNVPADTTEDIVNNIYTTAWECGCKGMTIYRDGSRDNVLVNNAKKKAKEQDVFHETQAPHRPKVLEADIIRFQNNYEQWMAVVGLLDGKPYEIFTGRADGFLIHPSISKGWIVKNKDENGTTRYDFEFTDKDGYRGIISGLSRSFDKQYWNYAKLISGILRHGMPLQYVVSLIQKMNFDADNINTWKNGVARALKKYIPDGTEIKGAECPECHQKHLIFRDGCVICPDCGASRCG